MGRDRTGVLDRLRKRILSQTSVEAIVVDEARVRLFLRAYLACLSAGILAVSAVSPFITKSPLPPTLPIGLAIVVVPSLALLPRWPRVAAVYAVFVWGLCLSFIGWRQFGSPNVGIFGAQLVGLIVAPFTVGRRWTIGYLSLIVLFHVASLYWLPPPPPSMFAPTPEPTGMLVGKVIALVTGAITMLITSWSFQRVIDHLKLSVKDLTESKMALEITLAELRESRAQEARLIHELQTLNGELEERVEAQTDALRQANDDLDAFAARASHDLRAPLRSISGFADVIAQDPGKVNDYLPRIRSLTKKMDALIQSILRFSRLGQRSLMPKQVDVEAQVRAVLAELPGNYRVEVGPLPAAWGDAELLEAIWQNLLSNAVKYSSREAEPLIRVSGLTEKGRCSYVVEDNGVGFDLAQADSLFQPFERLHGSEFEGVGVGLSTVRRVLRLHGGDIEAGASSLGGARFEFWLPVGG